MKIVALDWDNHIHSSTYSDGFMSVERIAEIAPRGAEEIIKQFSRYVLRGVTITDHSQIHLENIGMDKKTPRSITRRFNRNVYNSVKIRFGVEADLLNENGDIADEIDGKNSDYVVLSCHPKIFAGDKCKITKAYLNAIKKHADSIDVLGHITTKELKGFIDLEKIIDAGNKAGIPFEMDAAHLMVGDGYMDIESLNYMLKHANQVMINSDAHTSSQFIDARAYAFQFLLENGYEKELTKAYKETFPLGDHWLKKISMSFRKSIIGETK